MSKVVNKATVVVKKFVDGKAGLSDPVIETDSQKMDECIQFMERVFPNVVVVVCSRDRVNYVSANCQRVIGYDHKYFKSLSLEETLQLLNEDDVMNFKQCVERMTTVMREKPDAYKFVIYYRLKSGTGGEDVTIRDEKMAIATTSGKFIFLTLLQNISSEMAFFPGVKLTVLKQKANGEFIPINEFTPASSDEGVLSSRQADIARLINRGFANKAIADKLSLSINTVKNHKQAIFKKINVRNSLEMVASGSKI